MKVGIVTTHDEINFGAYLQAYSLQKHIESLGCSAELINYKSMEYKKAELMATYKLKNPFYLLSTIRKAFKFHKAQRKHMRVSSKLKTINDINKQNFDVLVFGSDEIWNLNNCLGGVIDNYYFGVGLKSRKISYAVSFGSTSEVRSDQVAIKESLLSFENVSVRDKNSEEVMQAIGSLNTTIVLDPTFLVEQVVTEPKIKTKYIFYYCVNTNVKLDKEVLALSEKLGIPVIAFGYKNSAFKSRISIDPFEWLGYLKNAEYVVTDMYHGTIFSIKYQKKFIVELTDYRENKLGFLIDVFGLRSRVYKENHLDKTIIEDINYEEVFKIISVMKNDSEIYIKNALKCL